MTSCQRSMVFSQCSSSTNAHPHYLNLGCFFNRNEDELWGWEADIWRDEKNLKDHVSYNLNSFSSLMFLIIIQQPVFFFFFLSNYSTEFGNFLGKLSTCSSKIGSKLFYTVLFSRGLAGPHYIEGDYTHTRHPPHPTPAHPQPTPPP